MKRFLALILVSVLTVFVCHAEEVPAFDALTGYDTFVECGKPIISAYYTDGFGFSTSEFTTTDQDEIAMLIDALGQIRVISRCNEEITDWYPQIVFKMGENDYFRVNFNKQWLMIGGMDNYEIEGDEGFWNLTRTLMEKYRAIPHDTAAHQAVAFPPVI